MAHQPPLLSIRDLCVKYGRVAAVRGISIDVYPHEVVGIIGANGAGKSSTLRAIMGFAPVASGSVTFEGESIDARKPDDIARLGIALVPEGRHIFSTLSVAENLALGGTARAERHSLPDAIEKTLTLFPILGEYFRTPAGRLSGGQQQQLAIARALVADPKLLMLDEPSLGLAPQMVDLVFDVLESLREGGITILLVEQNAMRTTAFADRTYVVRTGKVAIEGNSRSLLHDRVIAKAYLGY